MKFERKHAVLFLAVAVWNFVIYGDVHQEPHRRLPVGRGPATGYWVAHTVLIVVDLALGVVFAVLGYRLLRREPETPIGASRGARVGATAGALTAVRADSACDQ